MLQHSIRRRASCLERGYVGVVTPCQDPGSRHISRQKIRVSKPADFVFLSCPCRDGVAVEAMDSNNTDEAIFSSLTAFAKSVVLTRYLRLALESTAL